MGWILLFAFYTAACGIICRKGFALAGMPPLPASDLLLTAVASALFIMMFVEDLAAFLGWWERSVANGRGESRVGRAL